MKYRITIKYTFDLPGKRRKRALRIAFGDLPPAWRHMMVIIVPEDNLHAFLTEIYRDPGGKHDQTG